MYVSIVKPQGLYAEDYHDRKTNGHNIVAQSIVNRSNVLSDGP